jgi:hypothetical protein
MRFVRLSVSVFVVVCVGGSDIFVLSVVHSDYVMCIVPSHNSLFVEEIV